MGAEIPICLLCHTPRMPRRKVDVRFLGLPELSNVYSTHHDDSSGATEPQDAATEAAGSSSQRQDPSEGMSPTYVVKPWANGTGNRNTCQLCGAIINDKGEIAGTSKSIQRKLVSNEEKRHSNQKVEGRTELDLAQDEVDDARRLLEEAHVEVQAAQNKATEAGFRVGQAMEDMAQIRKLLGVNPEPTDQ